jgi:hypothetical protein
VSTLYAQPPCLPTYLSFFSLAGRPSSRMAVLFSGRPLCVERHDTITMSADVVQAGVPTSRLTQTMCV